MKIRSIEDIVGWDLCTGCGVCFDICPTNSIRLIHFESKGIRPIVNPSTCNQCKTCLQVCPGYKLDCTSDTKEIKRDANIGPYLEVWEGYSTDKEIRYKSASGGVLTSLSLYCLEKGYANTIQHSGNDSEKPLINYTHQSNTKQELLKRTASRYSPASPCDRLSQTINQASDSVFIGKPCDTAAVYNAIKHNNKLENKIKLIMSFFCAGTPNLHATKKILKKNGINKNDLSSLRYRGFGWPGRLRAITKNMGKFILYTYEDSWGQLNKHRSKRCLLCPDGLGHLSDLSCGDSWHNYAKNMGKSIIIIRTQRGMDLFKGAIKDKYITAERIEKNEVVKAQKNLLKKKSQIYGRLLAHHIFNIPVTDYKGYNLFFCWIQNTPLEIVKSIFGTFIRLWQRKQYKKTFITT